MHGKAAERCRFALRDLVKAQFEISIGPPPHKRNPRHPILAVDRLASPDVFLRRQNARSRGMRFSSHRSTDRAGRNAHLGIIANPLGLPHIAARHDVEFSIFFSKPDRGCDPSSGLAKSCKRDIFLTLNGGGNLAWHAFNSKRATRKSQSRLRACWLDLSSLVRNPASPIAPVAPSVLQA